MKTLRKSKIFELKEFDQKYGKFIIGTDEAGRGPGAGPVIAGAVYFPEWNNKICECLKFIDDSKRFSSNPVLRKQLSLEIKACSIYSIAEANVQEIEKYNILQASLLAMKRACEDLEKKLNFKNAELLVLVDGNFIIPQYKHAQLAVKKGDSLSASIAGASIIAKVHRDELMKELCEQYPCYNWTKNKGYLTKEHVNAIKTEGITEFHRKSFLSKIMSE